MGNYTIGVTGNNENLGMYRNDAVPSGIFPIQIADSITIVGHTTDSPESYDYYFTIGHLMQIVLELYLKEIYKQILI